MAAPPSGIVTLLTDFGVLDAYVGIMKGVLHTRAPELRDVVDLTHGVAAQDVLGGAFQLLHAWRWFPEGTVHVAVVDPGVGSDRRIVAARHGGHLFLAPDNGILAPVVGADAEVRVLDVERFALPDRSSTFHGRDVFAPTAAAMASGTPFEELGEPGALAVELTFPEPRRDGDDWTGEVLLVDRFGNLVSNLPASVLEGSTDGRTDWRVDVAGRDVPVLGTYADAGPGELLALVDSFGQLEVARRGGDAAGLLGCGRGEPFVLRRDR